MPISTPAEMAALIAEYRQTVDRFTTTTLILGDFAQLATDKGYATAEACLAVVCDRLNQKLVGTRSVVRLDIQTVFIVHAIDETAPRECVESRLRDVIRECTQGQERTRYATAIYPDDGGSSKDLINRMQITMPAVWPECDSDKGIDFSMEIQSSKIESYVQGVYRNDGTLRGVELLSRWNNDDVGVVGPASFVDHIYSQGISHLLIQKLLDDAKVINQKILQTTNQNAIVSLNINPSDITNPKVVSVLKGFAEVEHPDYIELEIIESDEMDGPAFGKEIAFLRSLGYRFAVDDFGSRYAWINSIGDDISTIKLDRSLTQRLSKGSNVDKAAMVVSSVVRMAEESGVEVIAEGIEDQFDYETMRQYKVTCLQGYFFGKPTSLSKFIDSIPLQEQKVSTFPMDAIKTRH